MFKSLFNIHGRCPHQLTPQDIFTMRIFQTNGVANPCRKDAFLMLLKTQRITLPEAGKP